MESASKDVLFTIAMNLELPDLLRWCQSNNESINQKVCNNENVWRTKLLKDYPDYHKFDLKLSLKETYIFMYQLEYIKKLLNNNQSLQDILLSKRLDLSHNQLKTVPAFNLPNLEILYLYKCGLIKVPSFNLPNLKVLNIHYNKLREVPSFDHLPNLTSLALDHNQLTKVPAFNLPNLEILSLDNNQLTEVPPFNLPNLQYLTLDNNQLKEIPVFEFPKLRKLSLYGNQLTPIIKKELKEKYGDKVQF